MPHPDPRAVVKRVTYRQKTIEVYIDRDDEAAFDSRTWCGSSDGSASRFYIISKPYDKETQKSSTLYLHRFLMNPPEGMLVDHRNGDTRDNRRCNLRIVTRAQNNANSRARRTRNGRPTTSTYKGVSRTPSGRWRAQITHAGTKDHLGTFDAEIEAARAYDAQALEYDFEHAYLNFPEAREGLCESLARTTT